jgi:hypothetical protein
MAAGAILVALFFGACNARTEYVALGSKYESHPLEKNSTRIVVIWPTDQMFGSGVQPRVLIKGTDVGRLEPLGYVDAIVDPGDVTVAVRYQAVYDGRMVQSAKNIVVAASPGSEIFVEYSMQMGMVAPDLLLKELPAVNGREKAKLIRKVVQN